MKLKPWVRHPVVSLDHWWMTIAPERRIDFNFGNMGMLFGLICSTLSIMLQGPIPNSILEGMSEQLQVMMCFCIFGGCGIKLHGALAGRRFWFPNMTLQRCYQLGYTGAPMATAGALVYGYYILNNAFQQSDSYTIFLSATSGVATPSFGIGISLQAVLYWLEARRIERNEKIIAVIDATLDGGAS